jgi:hypothetical protein
MTVWDELKVILARLRDEQPCTLTGFPMPEVDEGRQPPFAIGLAAWAAATAEDLHQRFGNDVVLTVGALPYPPQSRPHRPPAAGRAADLFDPQEAAAELDGAASVRSGQTLWHGLLITNHSGQVLRIATNGALTAVVVDPATAEPVGGFAGAQALPLHWFEVAPGATQRIPLLIGTASYTPRLGYQLPPGAWGIQATLTLGDYPTHPYFRRTPILPLTITAPAGSG